MSQTKQSHPDAELHPEATGLAKQTVSSHTESQDLKLYSGWFCPFVQRAWLVLEEKKIPYEYIEVNPYHKPDSLLKLNPRGLVPTLQYANKPLYESTVICQFLEEAYPDHGTSLMPKDVYDRARMRIWIDWITSRFIPSYHRFLQKQGDVETERQEFLGLLKEFAKEMSEDGPYFMCAEPMMIDFMLAPWAVRMWVFDHYKGGLNMPEPGKGGEDEKIWNRWRKWSSAIEERDSVKKTLSERQHYLQIYQRYADDKAQSEMAKATRSGKGVP